MLVLLSLQNGERMQDNSTAIYFGDPEWFRCIGGDGSWTGINQTNNNILYGSYQNLNIQKSSNGGTTFYGAAPPNLPNSNVFLIPTVKRYVLNF